MVDRSPREYIPSVPISPPPPRAARSPFGWVPDPHIENTSITVDHTVIGDLNLHPRIRPHHGTLPGPSRWTKRGVAWLSIFPHISSSSIVVAHTLPRIQHHQDTLLPSSVAMHAVGADRVIPFPTVSTGHLIHCTSYACSGQRVTYLVSGVESPHER